jgi:hypothetical protein
MGKHKGSIPRVFIGREQSNLKPFLVKLFEDGCPPEQALQALRGGFDAQDFARVRAVTAKTDAPLTRDVRGPRGKI